MAEQKEKTGTMRARRTHKVNRADSPTASTVQATPQQPALPESATKPLADAVAEDINATIRTLHRYGVENLQRLQMERFERDGHAPVMLIPPPLKTTRGVLVNNALLIGVVEREAVLAIVGAHVNAETLARITKAVQSHRGPVRRSGGVASWSKVGETVTANSSAYVMSLNLGDYAVAK